MNLTKKIISVVMVFVLVMCMGYFSMMSPTTAWSFQSQNVNGTQNTFVFADFDVKATYSITSSIKFKGATAMCDPEEKLFDSVLEIVEIDVLNEGGMPARIYASVENETETKGLHYFIFSDEILVDNSVKATIEKSLNGVKSFEALNNHNIGADGKSGYYILVNPGEIKTLKVALWVEYAESGIENAFGSYAWDTLGYRIKTTMTATQDIDGTLTR